MLVQEGDLPEPVLMDLKEAVPSVLQPLADPTQLKFANEAERMVAAQRLLQGHPTAGLASLTCGGRPFRIRAMIPDENRSSLDRLQESPARLREAVAAAGRITARSHWRGSHLGAECRAEALREWAASPALESVLAAAVPLRRLGPARLCAVSRSVSGWRIRAVTPSAVHVCLDRIDVPLRTEQMGFDGSRLRKLLADLDGPDALARVALERMGTPK